MNNKSYVPDVNPHILHTKELARYHWENILFSGVVYILFYLSLSRFYIPTDSLSPSPILSFSNTDLQEQSLSYVRIFNTYYKNFLISYNRGLINYIFMEFCLFQFSLQNAGFQMLRRAITLFISYRLQHLYFLPDQGGEEGQFFHRRKHDLLIDFISGHLDICWVETFCLIILYSQSHRRI